jgi:predicted transcriptional regulator
MISLVIQVEEDLATSLQRVADEKATTVEVLANEALKSYLRTQATQRRSYSFIGIGHSGKGNLSTQAEEILQKAVDRREGWSLHQ